MRQFDERVLRASLEGSWEAGISRDASESTVLE